jgi:hypothetical protein
MVSFIGISFAIAGSIWIDPKVNSLTPRVMSRKIWIDPKENVKVAGTREEVE